MSTFCSLESYGDGYRIAMELADYLATGMNVCYVAGRAVIPVCPTDVSWPAGPVVFGADRLRLGEVQVRDGCCRSYWMRECCLVSVFGTTNL